MQVTGFKAAVIVPCILLASCNGGPNVKAPTTMITHEDVQYSCIQIIAIDAKSNFTVNGEAVPRAALETRLKADGDCKTVIQADPNGLAGDLFEVYRILHTINPQPFRMAIEKSQE